MTKSECELGWKSHSHLPWNHLPWNHSARSRCLGEPSDLQQTKQQQLSNLCWSETWKLHFLSTQSFPCSWWMNNFAFRPKHQLKLLKMKRLISDLWHQPWNKVKTQKQMSYHSWLGDEHISNTENHPESQFVAAIRPSSPHAHGILKTVSLKNARQWFHGKFWAPSKNSLFRIRKTSPWLRLVFCYNRSAADGRRSRPQSWPSKNGSTRSYRRCVDKCHFFSEVSFGGRETKTYPMNDD